MQEELLVTNVGNLLLRVLEVVVTVEVEVEVVVVATIEEAVEDMAVIEGIGVGITIMTVEEVEVAEVVLMVMVRVEMMGDMARLPHLCLHMVVLCRALMAQILHMGMILLSPHQQAILVGLDHILHHMGHRQVVMVVMLLEIIGVLAAVVHLVVGMVVVKDIQVVVMVAMLQLLLNLQK